MDRQHLVSQRAPEKRNNTILVRCCSQQVEPRNAQGEEVVSCGRPPGEASKRWLSSRSAATARASTEMGEITTEMGLGRKRRAQNCVQRADRVMFTKRANV
ncbi:hypothetical protein I7I51_06483 [Histoplasma capsulatum]|uniref:Uncharacterized protein n=1 Tax=Ajellomyces capsulatus TaxID=5037 RepID=A0A8A1MNK3_AJECA|nr:hypothetical protein I7I51_06483 [Histoplasma capsulatum]